MSRRLTEDPRWLLAQRIVSSRSLGRSPLLTEFLLYVCDRQIRSREEEISEQQIGVVVFNRPEGYNSNEDNIVRSYARTLRKRIDEYFATEGEEETLRLTIPRGGYVPVFSSMANSSSVEVDEVSASERPQHLHVSMAKPDTVEEVRAEVVEESVAKPISHEGSGRETGGAGPGRWLILFCLLPAMLLAVFSLRLILVSRPAARSSTASFSGRHLLWSQLFSGDRDTFVVPADSGLVILQGITERPVSLANYISGSYRNEAQAERVRDGREILKLGNRRYTSVVDLEFVAQLAQLREVVPKRMLIRYARDLRMDDLRSGNAILLGSIDANPWVELFQSQMSLRFRFDPKTDASPVIVNMHPRPGESAIYANDLQDHTYGLITYLPNLDDTGHVLIVAGLNMAGTQAACAFLQQTSLEQTLERARTASGGLRPFEILVGASNVAANASSPHLILEHVGSATQ